MATYRRGKGKKLIPNDEGLSGKVFERVYNSKIVEQDDLKKLARFPKNDVVVKDKVHPRETKGVDVPPEVVSSLDDQSLALREFLDPLLVDWKKIEFTHEKNGTGEARPLKEIKPELVDIQGTTPMIPTEDVEIDEAFLKPFDVKVIRSLLTDFQENREDLLDFFPVKNIEKSDSRLKTVEISEKFEAKIVVELKSLQFEVGDLEPIYGSIGLYDRGSSERVSETFHFHLNDSKVMSSFDLSMSNVDPRTEATTAVFRIRKRSPDLYLVLRLYHPYRPVSLDNCCEPYIKGANLKPKVRSKLEAEIKDNVEQMGGLMQGFAWSAVQLYDDGGNLRNIPGFHHIVKYKGDFHDAELCEKLLKFSQKDVKKLKVLPGKVTMSVYPMTKVPEGLLNPELIPYDDGKGKKVSKVMMHFDPYPNYTPLMTYQHALYVYPQQVNLSGLKQAKSICLGVQYKENDIPNDPGLPLLYGFSNSQQFLSEQFTSIAYNNKKPVFDTELKVKLPLTLSADSHLLFTFYEVPTPKKKDKTKVQPIPIAFAVLPLLTDKSHIIKNGTHNLMTLTSLGDHYLSIPEEEVPYVDAKKPTFSVKTVVKSAIMPQEDIIAGLFDTYEIDANILDLQVALSSICKLEEVESLVHYLVPLCSGVLRIVCNPNEVVSREAFQTFLEVMSKVDHIGKPEGKEQHPLLVWYISQRALQPEGANILHDSLLSCLVHVLETQGRVEGDGRDEVVMGLVYEYMWTVFRLVVRSIVLNAADKGHMKKEASRDKRVSEEGVKLLKALVPLLAREVVHLAGDSQERAVMVSRETALFMKDLIGVMDRGVVLDMMQAYCLCLDAAEHSASVVACLKLYALKVWCDYEHFIALCIPVKDQIVAGRDIVTSLWKGHFFMGLYIRHTFIALQHPDPHVRKVALHNLRVVMQQLALDERYQEVAVRQRVMDLFLPLVVSFIQDGERENYMTQSRMDAAEKKILLLLVVHIMKSCTQTLMRAWWKAESTDNIVYLLEMLHYALELFAYDPTAKYSAPQAGTDKADTPSSGKRKGGRLRRLTKTTKHAEVVPSGAVALTNASMGTLHTRDVSADITAAHVSCEVSVTVLDIALRFAMDHMPEMGDERGVFAGPILAILIRILSQPQSSQVLVNVMHTLRVFASIFGTVLFHHTSVERIASVGTLIRLVMRCCTYEDSTVRSLATSVLYYLLRRNYAERKTLARMKLQMTVGTVALVDRLRGTADSSFHRALRSIAKRSQASTQKEFKAEVEGLMARLELSLENQRKLALYDHDPETKDLLMLETAESYFDSPDVRITWLQTLAASHEARLNLEEAAVCKIVIAALVCEYLEMIQSADRIPIGKGEFHRVVPGIETAVKVPRLDTEEGVCTGDIFTRRGLYRAVESAIANLTDRNLYESAVEIYLVLSTIHQKDHEWGALSETFGKMEQRCQEVVAANEGKNRLFSLFYRVGFFGSDFGDLDGNEYIYKEAPFTRVADFTSRLKSQFGGKFGADRIVILPNKPVDLDSLDASKLYVQIVDCVPYFSDEELKVRVTPFQQAFHINRFIFEVPFALEGKKIGEMVDTYKRKTILTVERPFPGMTNRAKVTAKKVVELTPIESSIELIQGRITAMEGELQSKFPNAKTLQIILQGSVLLQVNAGPLEICRLFLGSADQYPVEHVDRLRELFALFVVTCYRALELNQTLIEADQIEFHNQLMIGYEDMKQRVGEFVNPPQLGDEDDEDE